jgi:uncharacterized protein (TIGR02284 family)
MTITSIASTLNALIETCKDRQGGLRAAAENVKSDDFKLLFSDLSMQRRYFAGELQRLASNLGENVEMKGSFSAALHRGWMSLKAAVAIGDDRAILAECERGEDAAVAEYREALEHEDLPPKVRSVIQHQAMGIQAAHDRVHELCDRLQS